MLHLKDESLASFRSLKSFFYVEPTKVNRVSFVAVRSKSGWSPVTPPGGIGWGGGGGAAVSPGTLRTSISGRNETHP